MFIYLFIYLFILLTFYICVYEYIIIYYHHNHYYYFYFFIITFIIIITLSICLFLTNNYSFILCKRTSRVFVCMGRVGESELE